MLLNATMIMEDKTHWENKDNMIHTCSKINVN